MKKAIVTVLGGLGLLAAYSVLVEPNRLAVRRHAVGSGQKRLRVVQLTDIHIGPFYSRRRVARLVRRVNRLSPDVVVFTGDLYDRFIRYRREDAAEPLAGLQAPLGKFAVWGNHDCTKMARWYAPVLERAGFTLLENEAVILPAGQGRTLAIGGTDDLLYGEPDVQQTARGTAGSDYRIILMHEPDGADRLKGTGVDLILSGHTHGGQIRLPLLPTVTTDLGKKYIRGFYTIDPENSTALYVSQGIGCTQIPARLGAVPEIAVFDIQIP
ncbi:metallophosphoesterase [Eubacterium sp. 1001713B170207_170306_E7]|uniref:metallophosphoesterase n=1 Tax=Eubacterium sp. 1001713B170207_170306_E7 TaxID=2787097 RepID=UPI001899C896|nr:metallophosphoesterase [Eubacterium sp. 1001713B170207_170306_E7]